MLKNALGTELCAFLICFLDLLGNLKLSGKGSKASDTDKKSETNTATKDTGARPK